MLHDKHNLPLSLKSLNHFHQAWVVQSDDHGQNENVFFSLWIADDDDDGESN